MLSEIILNYIFLSGLANLVIWIVIGYYSFNLLKLPIYHPFSIFLFYHFVGFIIRPFSIYINGNAFLWDRIGFYPDGGGIFLVTLVANIALICVFFGMMVGFKRGEKLVAMPSPFYFIVDRPKPFFAVMAVLVILGLYSNYTSIAGAGLDSVLAYETDVDGAGGGRLIGTSGYLTALAEFLPPICIMLFMIPKTRMFALLLTSAFISMRIYAGAQRLSFVIVIAGIFFYYLIAKERRFPSMAVVVGLFVFAYVFDVVGGDRYAFRRLLEGTASISEIVDSHKQTRGSNGLTSDVVEYDVATATLAVVVDNSAYTYGSQYFRLLIWPIPRQLWNDKPVFTSSVNLNDYGDFRYLTVGVYADTFMAFSFLSLALMMAILGYFFSRIYRLMLFSNSVSVIMFYWVVLIFTKTILRDGGVTVFYFWIFSMVPVILLVYAGGMKVCRIKN